MRDLAYFLGILVAAWQAVNYGIFYSEILESKKYLALESARKNC